VPVETDMLCEVWEEELPAPFTSSKLYCLKPIGIGTPMVESLTSYISRLAYAHSVLLRTLVTNEILPNLNRTHLYREGQTAYAHLTTFWKRSAILNGTCSTSSNWVSTIEQLTQRNDLRCLTMLTFANVLSWRELVRPTQAWCPLCYEEWRKKEQVLYQPLIWQLTAISNCSQHHIPLHLHCPYKDCGRALPPLGPRFQPGYCTHCNRWLGMPFQAEARQAISRGEQEWQLWIGQAVGELLASVPDLITIPDQDVFSTSISVHVNRAMRGNFSEFARQVQFHRRTVWEWAQGLQVPKLDTLLRICSYFGTTPIYLFMGNLHGIAQIKKDLFGRKPLTEQAHRQFKRFEVEKLRNALELVLRSEEYPPPSMREVAHRLNHDQSHLRIHFPDLCRAISVRYLAYQQAQRQRRLEEMSAKVQQTAQVLHEQGYSLSERQVGKMLGKRGIFKEDAARTALRNFFTN
jgi:transcriptional regulator with XRE-family HTH domain